MKVEKKLHLSQESENNHYVSIYTVTDADKVVITKSGDIHCEKMKANVASEVVYPKMTKKILISILNLATSLLRLFI